MLIKTVNMVPTFFHTEFRRVSELYCCTVLVFNILLFSDSFAIDPGTIKRTRCAQCITELRERKQWVSNQKIIKELGTEITQGGEDSDCCVLLLVDCVIP